MNAPLKLLLVAFIFSSCSQRQTDVLNALQSPLADMRPATFDAVQSDMVIAQKDRVNLIDPVDYSKAMQALQRATKHKNVGDSYQQDLVEARQYLDHAVNFAKPLYSRLQPLLDARQTAIQVGAQDLKRAEFAKAEKNYVRFVTGLHIQEPESNLGDVEALTTEFQQVTLLSLEKKYLQDARAQIQMAKDEGAAKVIPKTLKQVENFYEETKKKIATNPLEKNSINEQTNKLNLQARRLLVLNRESKAWAGLSPEDISLKVEDLLSRAQQEAKKDIRDRPFEDQVEELGRWSRSNQNVQ